MDMELSDGEVIVVIVVVLLSIYLSWDDCRRNSFHLLFTPVTSPAKPASNTGELGSVLAAVAVAIFGI